MNLLWIRTIGIRIFWNFEFEDFNVNRCFNPPIFNLISVQLHHFFDENETGHGMVFYLRLENAL